MSKFTPGPWQFYSPSAVNGDHFSIAQADGAPYTHWASDVCTIQVISGTQPHEVAEANARLIAAAPELLALVKEIDAHLVNPMALGDLIDKAEKIIAKAGGA